MDDLLQAMAKGEDLSEAELKHGFSDEFVKELESKGISRDALEGMCVRIGSCGDVSVDGIEDETVREQVQKLVVEKYSDRMYRYYTEIADSVGDLPSNVYRYVADVQEVRRYLKGVTGEDVFLESLYLTPDGKIGGLPDKAADLINRTKNNVRIERIKDALADIIGNIRISGDLGIPDFVSEFGFGDGAFFAADRGFAVDVDAIAGRLGPQSSGNMYSDMYEYRFERVL